MTKFASNEGCRVGLLTDVFRTIKDPTNVYWTPTEGQPAPPQWQAGTSGEIERLVSTAVHVRFLASDYNKCFCDPSPYMPIQSGWGPDLGQYAFATA